MASATPAAAATIPSTTAAILLCMILLRSVFVPGSWRTSLELRLITWRRGADEDFMDGRRPGAHVHHGAVSATRRSGRLVKVGVALRRTVAAIEVDGQDLEDSCALCLQRWEQIRARQDVV